MLSHKGIKPTLAILGSLTVLQSIVILFQAYFLATSISSLFGGDLFRMVKSKLLLFFLALVLRQLLTFLKNNISYRYAVKTSEDYRKSLVEKLFQLGPLFVKQEGSGQTVTFIMDGMMKFQRYLELLLPKSANMAIIPVSVCLFIFLEDIQSAVILVITFPILVLFMTLLGIAAKGRANRQYKSHQLLANHFVDSLRGLETLKYLGLSRSHIEKIRLVSEQYRKATISTLKIAFLSTFALDFFTMLSVAVVAVFLGIGLIDGAMELKTALTILILAPEFFLPVRDWGADFHSTLDGKEVGKKMEEILRQEGLVQFTDPIPAWETTSELAVRGLCVKGLENVHFTIKGTKKVGVIGASGAGKSTLIEVLSGFLSPEKGEFMVNGKKLSTLTQADWQAQSVYIPQHPHLFSDTVLENIRFYQPTATDQEVLAAADAAGLLALIGTLPDGLQTIVGEGGRTLSGGQEQRIAIARAFLGNRPILLLDEPTAHLDLETEYELKETMLKLFHGKVVFLATHRLHWMRDMDQILVLDKGKLVESGTHEELMAQRGFYNRLVGAQMEESTWKNGLSIM